MTNEEKAKDITKCLWFPQKCMEGDIQNMLMQMAEWKDEQDKQEKQKLIDKLEDWLANNICTAHNFRGDNISATFMNDCIKAMKGE